MTEAELAESIYWEAEQYIPFDIQDVNLDYQILDPGTGAESEGHDGRPARRGEEGKDRRLHRRHLPGRPHAGDRRRRRLRPAERLRSQLRPRARARWSCCSTPAPARSTSTSSPATSRSSRATSRWAATPTPRRCRRSSTCRSRAPSRSKKGQPVDGVDVRGRAAGAARDDRERAARDPEDVRLLQGDRRRPIASIASCVSGGASRVDGFTEALQERFGTAVEVFDPFKTIAFDAGEARHRAIPRGSRRRRPSRSVSRCERRATDDSHQPARRRARDARRRRRSSLGTAGQKLTVGCSLILVLARARRRLALLVARAATRRSSTRRSPPRSRRRRGCTR